MGASNVLDLVGYRVLGRHGDLGTVVTVRTDGAENALDAPMLVVRGGSTELLLYHVPFDRLRGIVPEERLAISEVDVTDFEARLRDDGTVELYLER